jgi:Protein of unknown function (DUF2752)
MARNCDAAATCDGSATRFRAHRDMIVVALAVVMATFALEVTSDQRVALRFLPGAALPETCGSRSLLGVDCPGCGLTRSFVHLAHGRWKASWNVHRVGWLMALAVILQFPYRILALRSADGMPMGTSTPKLFGTLLIVVLVLNWLMDLISRLAEAT